MAAYPDLDEDDIEYLQSRISDQESLAMVIERLEEVVRSIAEPPSKGIEMAEEAPVRYVNTGFASQATPAELNKSFHTPLAAGQPCYFWLQIGALMAEGMAQEGIALPTDKLPPEARLTIALFAYDGEIELTGAETGEIQLAPEGNIKVTRRAAEPAGVPATILDERLYFAVRTMTGEAYGRLRCNIYYQNNLVQSHLIVARVAAAPAEQPYRMLWHTSDYTLSKSLDSEQLVAMGENVLSVMVNNNGNGSHGFRFMGKNEFKNDATLTAGAIDQLQDWTRGALRKAAWGDEEEYKSGKKYLYGSQLDMKKLKADLLNMAINGVDAYDSLIDTLTGDYDQSEALKQMMRQPGQVQIANKEAAQLVVPAAMFYDYPFLRGNVPEDQPP